MSLISAKNKPLFETSANLPDVGGAVTALLYPVIFEKVQTTLIDGKAQKVPVKFQTMASVQSLTGQQLKIKPEGQRNWKWHTIHALTDLVLNNNDRIKVNGMEFKIMERFDWSKYGYVEYHAIEDYVSDGSNNG